MRLANLIRVAALLVCCASCSDAPTASEDSTDTLSRLQKSADTSARVLVMPAPLQIPTLLLQHGTADAVFAGTTISFTPEKPFPGNYHRAVYIGMTSVDLGYFGLHNDRIHALEALTAIEKELRELNYKSGLPAVMRRTLEHTNNTSMQDSLSKTLLAYYMQLQKHSTQESVNRNGVFIMCGAYLEGLYLLLRDTVFRKNDVFPILLAQQKTWAANLMEAISYLPQDDETQDLYNTLYTVEYYLSQSELRVTAENVPARQMSPENTALLYKKVVQLRNSYIPL
jgi:hypothetical protein